MTIKLKSLQISPGACLERKISRYFAPRNDKSMGFRQTLEYKNGVLKVNL